MKAALIIGVLASFAFGIASPALAEPIAGDVEEIITKTKTKDGHKC